MSEENLKKEIRLSTNPLRFKDLLLKKESEERFSLKPIKNLHGNTCITGDFSYCVIFQGSVPYTFPTIKWFSTLKLFFINWNLSRFFRLWGSPNPGFSKVTCSWPERNFFCCEGYKLALKNKSTFFQILVFLFFKKESNDALS